MNSSSSNEKANPMTMMNTRYLNTRAAATTLKHRFPNHKVVINIMEYKMGVLTFFHPLIRTNPAPPRTKASRMSRLNIG